MAPFEAFETLLKEVVQAKRLSASKMGNLTDIAMKSMEQDTQLVSILYRTHKSLPPSAKVSSLYIFDALCRAARHQAQKQGIVGDINSPTGNCATFLLKVEGVLEGLFQDMVAIGTSESKEKTKKILDIWVKGNTFPAHVLSRMMDVVVGTEKVSEMNPLTTSNARTPPHPDPSTPTPPTSAESPMPPATDPQATLLALLAQAANAVAIPAQTTPNTQLGAGLDAAQLAVLHQLALAQSASNAAPSQPTQVPPQAGSALTGAPSHREEASHSSNLTDRRQNMPQYPERVNTYDDQVDEPSSSRGISRGGFRGRWRGEGRRWGDRDRDRYRDRERDDPSRSPVRRARRSRSRSPPSKFGGRRDVRPYSPPRRPMGFMGRRDSPDPPRDPNKDEFGRDIRPQSPQSDNPILPKPKTPPSLLSPPPPPPTVLLEQPTKEESPTLPFPSNHDQMSLTPSIAANTSSSTHSAPLTSDTVSTQSGMENFNPATFDFTSPSAWEALGKMWQVTYGNLPRTEQLMQFVVAAQATLATSCDWSTAPAKGSGNLNNGNGGYDIDRGRIGGPYGNGNTRNGYGKWTNNDLNHGTDAVVLGGGSSPSTSADIPDHTSQKLQGGGGGGRMQKLGDKWVFVREPA